MAFNTGERDKEGRASSCDKCANTIRDRARNMDSSNTNTTTIRKESTTYNHTNTICEGARSVGNTTFVKTSSRDNNTNTIHESARKGKVHTIREGARSIGNTSTVETHSSENNTNTIREGARSEGFTNKIYTIREGARSDDNNNTMVTKNSDNNNNTVATSSKVNDNITIREGARSIGIINTVELPSCDNNTNTNTIRQRANRPGTCDKHVNNNTTSKWARSKVEKNNNTRASQDNESSRQRHTSPSAVKSNETKSTDAPNTGIVRQLAATKQLTTRSERNDCGKCVKDEHNQPNTDQSRRLNQDKTKIKFITATQNFRGAHTEEAREEVRVQMKRQGIDLICGQESWLQEDRSQERWETGEVFINCGGQSDNKRKHDGVSFFLSSKMASKFEKGGRQIKKYSSRLATLRLPLSKKTRLYIINAHCPDSSQTQTAKTNFQVLFEKALQNAKQNETLLVMGDFNADMGRKVDEQDVTCGVHGMEHSNTAGLALKQTACLYGLKDLVSFQEQPFLGTWVHPRSKKWHQLDRIMMKHSDSHMVQKCTNAEMLTDSDHFSVRLNLSIDKPDKVNRTVRQVRGMKDITNHFSPTSTHQQSTIDKVRKIYEDNENTDEHSRLTTAIVNVINELPDKPRKKAGWCDLNFKDIATAVEERNEAAKDYATSKTLLAKDTLKRKRSVLKKIKIQAKNEWILNEIRDSNNSVLPGRGDRKSPASMWSLAHKLENGLDKWRRWDDSNVKNKNGKLATTPEENAVIFQSFFNELFSNDSQGAEGKAAYKDMKYTEVTINWGEPKRWELIKAINNLKHTAPGISGIPAIIWQCLSKDQKLQDSMLKIIVKCWVEETIPEDWSKFHMCVLPKKGDLAEVANYRGISMAETLSKVYSSIIKLRLEGYYESIAPEYCNGFRAGRGRTDSIFTLKTLLRKRKAKGLDSYGIFYDFIKCFDKLARENIWESMRVSGVDEKMIKVVKSTLLQSTCQMNVSGIEKDINMKEGSGQGTTLGPILCNFFFLPLLKDFQHKMKNIVPHAYYYNNENEYKEIDGFTHNFADDTCMVTNTLQDAKVVALTFNTYMKSFKSKVHVATDANPKSKSVIVYYPVDEKDTELKESITVSEDGKERINFAKGSPYLGSLIQSNLRDDDEIRGRLLKASQMFGKLRRHLLGSKDVWGVVKRKVMQGMILPIMLDGAENWVISAKILLEIQTTYNKMIRGCMRITTHTTRKHRITTSDLLNRLKMEPIQYYLD